MVTMVIMFGLSNGTDAIMLSDPEGHRSPRNLARWRSSALLTVPTV